MKITILITYTLLVLATSLIPMDREIQGLNFIINLKASIQNLLHIPAYAVLSILWLQVVGKRLLFVLVVTIAFGIFNELVQLAIPGRYPGIMDIAMNTIGSILGIMLYYKLETKGEKVLTGLTVYFSFSPKLKKTKIQ